MSTDQELAERLYPQLAKATGAPPAQRVTREAETRQTTAKQDVVDVGPEAADIEAGRKAYDQLERPAMKQYWRVLELAGLPAGMSTQLHDSAWVFGLGRSVAEELLAKQAAEHEREFAELESQYNARKAEMRPEGAADDD